MEGRPDGLLPARALLAPRAKAAHENARRDWKERVKCYDLIVFREESVSDQMQPVREKISVGCTVFGNRITPKLAYEEVSREHIVLRSDTKIADPRVHLLKALEDCKESGWRLCAPQ